MLINNNDKVYHIIVRVVWMTRDYRHTHFHHVNGRVPSAMTLTASTSFLVTGFPSHVYKCSRPLRNIILRDVLQ